MSISATSTFNVPIVNSNLELTTTNSSSVDSTESTNQASVTNAFRETFKLEPLIAEFVTRNIFNQQRALGTDEAVAIAANESFDLDLVISRRRFYALEKSIGEGTHSEVIKARAFATERYSLASELLSPSKPRTVAIKRGLTTSTRLLTEKRNLDAAIGDDKLAGSSLDDGIDWYYDAFCDRTKINYSLHQLYSGDITNINFDVLEDPILALLNILESCADGLKRIHMKRMVHCDIKGANLLYSIAEEQTQASHKDAAQKQRVKGALSDFGFMHKESTQIERTAGTPLYLDPMAFGRSEDTLLRQKERRGILNRESDIYAFGLTIYKDMLIPLLTWASAKNSDPQQVEHLISEILPQKIVGKFTNDQLQTYGRDHPFRVNYHAMKNGQECIIMHAELESIRLKVSLILSSLKEHLTPKQIAALEQLSALSCNMQDCDYAKRPDIHDFVDELKKIFKSYQTEQMTPKRQLNNDSTLSPVLPRQKKPRKWVFATPEPTQIVESLNASVCAPSPKCASALPVAVSPLRSPLAPIKENVTS